MVVVNIISLYNLCEGDKSALLQQLQEWNLIPLSLQCGKCGGSLALCEDASRIDGWKWRCRNRTSQRKQKAQVCDHVVSLRTGTLFARSKLPIFKVLGFVNLWVGNASLLLIQQQLELAPATCEDWASFCREVLLTHFVHRKTKLGGPGLVVEINESKFGNSHKGGQVDGQWVFGGYERGTGRVFMVTVEDRGADTLIPLIEQWIEPGTTIVSDYWKAYDCIDRRGYIHLKADHSVNFRDPDTAAHTNGIMSSWRAAKAIATASGREKAHIPGNLARYIFYKKCAELKLNRTVEFFRLAGEIHNAALPECELASDNIINEADIEHNTKTKENILEPINKQQRNYEEDQCVIKAESVDIEYNTNNLEYETHLNNFEEVVVKAELVEFHDEIDIKEEPIHY